MCEFCKNIMPFSYGISTYSNMGITIGDDIKPHIYTTTLNEDDGSIVTLSGRPIKYCFECGRKLVKGMKHSKEWHTCDRCGAELTEDEIFSFNKKECKLYGYGSKNFKMDALFRYELCPKCRKEFERFMKNE